MVKKKRKVKTDAEPATDGLKIKPQTISRRVHTVDVAPTLANIVGAKSPSGASGEVLLEVLRQKP